MCQIRPPPLIFETRQKDNLLYYRRPTTTELPESTKIVICGGGAQGAAIAYKLGIMFNTYILNSGFH